MTKTITNMENRVAKHLRLEINIVCTFVHTYWDLHLRYQPDQHLRAFLRGFEDVKNVQKIYICILLVHTHDISPY